MQVVLFCGHRSMFGRQVLGALRGSRLSPQTVVLGTNTCWNRFDRKLNKQSVRGLRKHARTVYYARKFKAWVRQELVGTGVQTLWLGDVNSTEGLEQLKKLNADIFIGAAYPQIFGGDFLQLPKHGCFNLHPSLLPAFAGAHPHFWAIRTGAKMSGVTAHLATEKIDRGAIISQVPIPIEGKSYSEFYQAIGAAIPALVQQMEQHFLEGAPPVLHNEDVEASWFNNNQPEDARINWLEHRIVEVEQLIRTEIAWCVYRTKKLRLISGEVFQHDSRLSENAPPGRIMRDGSGKVHIRCSDGWLRVNHWKWERDLFRPRLQSGEMVY